MDYNAFVSSRKSKVIAPAGYGKTYSIVQCLNYTEGRQLILTHTHAGIASIKAKIKKANIPSQKYRIETISSFAQKYVRAFYTGDDVPLQEAPEYHSFLILRATELFSRNAIKEIFEASYSGLFVDEYQDCTVGQHRLICELSNILPTHILGDPLQGIFEFGENIVDFDRDLLDFEAFPTLETPYRWYQDGNNRELGNELAKIRQKLIDGIPINLNDHHVEGFTVNSIAEEDELIGSFNEYKRQISRIINNRNNSSLLVIVPSFADSDGRLRGTIIERQAIKAGIDFSNSLELVEAIDDKSFYSLSKKIDETIASITRARKPINKLKNEILEKLFKKTDIAKFISNSGFICKRQAREKEMSQMLETAFTAFFEQSSPKTLENILILCQQQLKFKCGRPDFLRSILKALKIADEERIPVYEAMKNYRDRIRRVGRKVDGKCIGTTLLTKGLEFDVVAILDAHKFNCPKNLYVALTRAAQQLIIFTKSNSLNPY